MLNSVKNVNEGCLEQARLNVDGSFTEAKLLEGRLIGALD